MSQMQTAQSSNKPLHWLSQMILNQPPVIKTPPPPPRVRCDSDYRDSQFLKVMGSRRLSIHEVRILVEPMIPDITVSKVAKHLARMRTRQLVTLSDDSVIQPHSTRPLRLWSVK